MGDRQVMTGNTAAFAKFTEGGDVDIRLSQHRSQFVSQLEPKYLELARAKRLYGANSAAGTAKAPLTALPTTTATWMIYNPTTSSRVLIPLKAYCWSVSGTLGLDMGMALAIPPTVVATPPTKYSSSVIHPLNPGAQTTTAIFGQGVTVAAPVWSIAATRTQPAAIGIGSGLVADLDGMYIIEPGFGLGGAVVAPTGTTALFGFGFTWAELDLDRG